ncbi:MAG: hypothetical protein WB661_06415 [Candidatus Bathyarchaeia archaeon]
MSESKVQVTRQELLHREEVRGLFVLGVIAAILAYKSELASLISPAGVHVGDAIVEILVATWKLRLHDGDRPFRRRV